MGDMLVKAGDWQTVQKIYDLWRDLRNAQPGTEEGIRGFRRADLLAVPVNLGRSRGSTVQPMTPNKGSSALAAPLNRGVVLPVA